LNPPASLEEYRWLLGPDGRRWLETLATERGELVQLASRLRKQLSAAQCRLVLEQLELRRRAKQKFAAAERMFFTPTGLEQATDQWVAAYKASRFPADGPFVDLCCGIGGDLLALTQRGATLGVDRSEIAALFAAANLAALGDLAPAKASGVDVGDVEHAALDGVAAWHIDPDRRPQGRRTTRVELHEPGPDVIDRLRAVCGAAAVKLAPAAELPQSWQQDAEWEWISRGGECRQLVVWFGPLARSCGLRRATVVSRNAERGTRSADSQASGGRQPPGDFQATADSPFESQTTEQGAGQGRGAGDPDAGNFEVRSIVGRPALDIPAAAKLGRYLAEPDAAVLAAELSGELAAERKLAPIAPGSAYLTGDQAEPDAALAWFEVSDVLPFDLKRLKALLRQRGCGRLEIKKRGVPHDPEQIRRQLRVPGDNSATVFITRIGGGVTAIVARRIERRS
jgi:hypothetical protein